MFKYDIEEVRKAVVAAVYAVAAVVGIFVTFDPTLVEKVVAVVASAALVASVFYVKNKPV